MKMTKNAALLKCDSYDRDLVYKTLKNLVELIPPPDVTGKTILLKPNILQPKSADLMICTHPVVVGQAVKIFLELGAKKIIVGESPATASSLSAAKASGIYNAVIENGGEWHSFDKSVSVSCNESKLVKSFNFAEPFLEADMVVTISKLKTHQLLAYTGAMKNLFGLLVGLQKAETHFRFPNPDDFSAFLTDVNVAAKPIYGIMDAIVAMEGNGPASGNPHKVGVLGASDNVLALDWAFSSLIGYNPIDIPNLKDALSRGIWGDKAEDFGTVGDDFDSLKPKNFKTVKHPRGTALLKPSYPKFVHKLAQLIFSKYPTFNAKKCIRCGKCTEICPAHVLTIADVQPKPTPHLDKTKCIHCYCCHEICPVDAIKLRNKL